MGLPLLAFMKIKIIPLQHIKIRFQAKINQSLQSHFPVGHKQLIHLEKYLKIAKADQ